MDIWSVGCTIVEMATGKRPFHNVDNRYVLIYKIGNDKQPPEIPADLSDTAKDFLDRYELQRSLIIFELFF